MNITTLIFAISIVWTFIGILTLHSYEENSCAYNSSNSDFLCYLNPIWIWKNYKVNIIGCILLTVLFNLICPIISIIYWIIELIGWICTAGRK
jgi:hypothetical protein